MSGINRLPRGLLKYLDIQAQGQNPDQIGPVVSSILNLEPFYRSSVRYEYRQQERFDIALTSDVITWAVPDDEIWLVHQAGCTILNTSGAVGAASADVRVVGPGTLAGYGMPVTPMASKTAGFQVQERVSAGQTFSAPLVLTGGYSIQCAPGLVITVAAITMSMSMIYNRLQV